LGGVAVLDEEPTNRHRRLYLQQLTADSGSGAKLGDFNGRVFGIGPQVGFTISILEGYQGYLNLQAYKDIGAENRPEGYTAWVTFSL
jgi:hypothetical protein